MLGWWFDVLLLACLVVEWFRVSLIQHRGYLSRAWDVGLFGVCLIRYRATFSFFFYVRALLAASVRVSSCVGWLIGWMVVGSVHLL